MVGGKKALAVILLIAIILRAGPVLLYGMPLSYDTPFHIRNAQIISGAGTIPLIDYSLGSRPNNYPPLYHLLLGCSSIFSGLDVFLLAMFLLPLVSALLPLSIFILVKRLSSIRKALVASLLAALASPLIAAAYDSPENIVLFMLPLALFLYARKSFKAGSLLYATSILWNYLAAIVTLPALLITYHREKGFLKYLAMSFAAVISFQLATRGLSFLDNKSLGAAMDFITFNLRNLMPALAIAAAVFFIPITIIALKGKLWKEARFSLIWSCISFAALISFLFTPLLRPWEHFKFLALAGIMLIGLSSGKVMQMIAVMLVAFFLISSLVISCQSIFPRITRLDRNAMRFLEEKGGDGKILADPSFSEYFRIYTALENRLLTSLYFENTRKDSFLDRSLLYLSNSIGQEEKRFVEESGLQFIITNFEDEKVRGTGFLAGKKYLSRVYSLGYTQNCPFPFLPKSAGYACGPLETNIYEVVH